MRALPFTQPVWDCRHCGPTRRVRRSRGLCDKCFYNKAIRVRYDGPRSPRRREWTAREVAALRSMRRQSPPVPVAVCAVRLKRSLSSVQNACHREGLQTYVRAPLERERAVLRLWDGHRTDGEIAGIVGCLRQTIQKTRARLGIAGHPQHQARRRRAMVRCWSCPARVPTVRVLTDGWASRPLPGKREVTECYCPRCFARWGWPDGYGVFVAE